MKNNDRSVSAQSSKIGCLAVSFDPQSSSELTGKIMYFLEISIRTDKATAIKMFQYADVQNSPSFSVGGPRTPLGPLQGSRSFGTRLIVILKMFQA